MMIHGESCHTSTVEREAVRELAVSSRLGRKSRPTAGPGRAPSVWRRLRLGQSMVELSLVLPVLILVLLGTIDLGRAFFDYVRLTNAVREGALAGVVTPNLVTDDSTDPDIATYPGPTSNPPALSPVSLNNDSVKYRVKAEGGTYLNLTNSMITVTCYGTPASGTWTAASFVSGNAIKCNRTSSGDMIEVKASYTFRPFSYEIIRLLGSGFTMSKTVRMVII